MSVIEQIDNIQRYSKDLDTDVRSLLYAIGPNLPIVPLGLLEQSKLIRGAVNWVPAHFESVSQLSYRPAKDNKYYQRASIPEKTMFYTCPFTHSTSFENGVFIPRLTSLLEIRSLYTQVGVDGVQRVTFSRWDSSRTIKVFALPFLGEYKRACDEVEYIRSIWSQNIASGSFSEDAFALVRYLSEDISKKKDNSNDYAFTAIFIDWFLGQHKEYDGVYYPSVQTEGEGANIAFKPDLVDDGSIVFVEATECWLLKRGMLSKMMTAVKLHNNQGVLTPEYMPLSPQVQALCDDFPLEGLSFLN